jgi:NAD(P)-dependent dehydrogenase (short-subunit alcohol dehydrogenase family)
VARSGIAAKGVTINNLLPGKFDTDRIATTLRAAAEKTGKSVADIRQAQQAQIPAGRYGTAEEFGAICAFLCSQQAAYLTGQNILPDGGGRQRRDDTTMPPTINANANSVVQARHLRPARRWTSARRTAA